MGQRHKITLVVGHQRMRPGAWAVAPLSCHEYEYNTHLAAVIAQEIQDDFDFAVVFRDGMSIDETYKKVESLQPSANIELHFNSVGWPETYGTETLCSERDVAFATMVQTAMCETLGRDKKGNRGVKILRSPDDRGYGSVSKLDVPNIIIEPFFGSNKTDAELGRRGQQLIALAIKKALSVWFLWDSDGSE